MDGAKARKVYEEAVEYLCRNIDSLRELIDPTLWAASFAVVQDGDPSSGEWRDAVRDLHNAAEAAGIPGGLGLHSTMGGGGWPASPTSRSVGWVCPTGRCARVDLRGEAISNAPQCALADQPMRLVDG
ncbi:hypothetical protein ACWGCW_06225 [Streptomyces sp. NPDC054933]